MHLVDDLVAARTIVTKGWAKGALARHANNFVCSVRDPRATRYDVMGAVFVSVPRERWALTLLALRDATDSPCTLPEWNDNRDRDDAVELFDKAILRARMNEQ